MNDIIYTYLMYTLSIHDVSRKKEQEKYTGQPELQEREVVEKGPTAARQYRCPETGRSDVFRIVRDIYQDIRDGASKHMTQLVQCLDADVLPGP